MAMQERQIFLRMRYRKKEGIELKRIVFVLIIGLCMTWSFSVGCAYGASNIAGYYPRFDRFLSLSPSRDEVVDFVESAKDYVEACNNDIEMIAIERDNAINAANDAITNYNLSH